MKWLNCSLIVIVLAGFVAAIVLGGGTAKADFTFGESIQLGEPIWYPGHDPQGCCFSGDGLELYFSSNRPGGYGRKDIWVATREALDASWGEPVNLGSPVNDAGSQIEPAISPDGLELYYGSWFDRNIRVCKRPSKDAPWSSPAFLDPPIGLGNELQANFSADGLSLYFISSRSGTYGKGDVWVSTRATTDDPWGEPTNLGPNVNTSGSEGYPSISSDGRILFFNHGTHIWVTKRATKSDTWAPPVNCNIIGAPPMFDPTISPDGSVLYFETSYAMWQSSITPIVDLNGDGIVDSADMCIMIDHWGTDEPLCDIGPMPWGDGVVDVEDLKVLADYIGENVIDGTLIAHWALDEAEGVIARDGARDNDGTVIGTCAWQPIDGQVNGALALDGTTSIVADRVLNPADGPFSVLAWIKGGAPGQVIISQAGGENWLMVDAETGTLATDLVSPTRRFAAPALISDTVLTDDIWHRIGFVWDGTSRALYVDDVLVAEDFQDALAGCLGDMNIGCDKDMTPGTFWEGLIDDVRIYNRAVRP
jgi:hypothetical protein